MIGKILSFVWFAFVSALLYAAPLGGDPTQGYCQTVDGSACGWGGQPPKVINIPSRYGAIALDGGKLILGSSENNLKSIRSAKKEAVQDCINLGGSKTSCKVVVSTRNGCIALALGGKGKGGVHFGTSRPTLQQAGNDAMQGCREMGGENAFWPIPNAPAIRAIRWADSLEVIGKFSDGLLAV